MIIVTMGLFTMKQTQGFVSGVNLSKTQINEFNSIWTGYEMLQKGSTIKGLFQKLSKNAEENAKYQQKLIDVAYNTTGGLDYGSKIYMFSADLKTNNPGVWTTGINKIFSTDSIISSFTFILFCSIN